MTRDLTMRSVEPPRWDALRPTRGEPSSAEVFTMKSLLTLTATAALLLAFTACDTTSRSTSTAPHPANMPTAENGTIHGTPRQNSTN